MSPQHHVTKRAMMNTVVEAYRNGALVAGPIPYSGHPENAQHLARRTALEFGADFVRVLDQSGKEEQWSERLAEQPVAKPANSQGMSMSDQKENNQGQQQQQNPTAKCKQRGANAEPGQREIELPLSDLTLPHWLMIAGAALVTFGALGLLLRRNDKTPSGTEGVKASPADTADLPPLSTRPTDTSS